MTLLSSPQKIALNDQQPLFVHSLFPGIRYRGVCCWTTFFSRSVQHRFAKLDQSSDRMLVTRPQVILLKLSVTTRSYIGRLTSTCSDLGLLKIMADMRIKPDNRKVSGHFYVRSVPGVAPPVPQDRPGHPSKNAPPYSNVAWWDFVLKIVVFSQLFCKRFSTWMFLKPFCGVSYSTCYETRASFRLAVVLQFAELVFGGFPPGGHGGGMYARSGDSWSTGGGGAFIAQTELLSYNRVTFSYTRAMTAVAVEQPGGLRVHT
jgi:hypothetical protein